MLVVSFLAVELQDYLVLLDSKDIPSVLLSVLVYVLGLETEGLLNTLHSVVLPLTSDLLIKYNFVILIFFKQTDMLHSVCTLHITYSY